jgi:hypothetical protein
MLIMPDAKFIEKVHLGLANFLDGHYLRLKQRISPSVVVVHNLYGCDKLSRTIDIL